MYNIEIFYLLLSFEILFLLFKTLFNIWKLIKYYTILNVCCFVDTNIGGINFFESANSYEILIVA